jgi:hypothetical protein
MKKKKKLLKKKMRINLSNKFYKKEAIEATMKAFENACKCKIINGSFEIEIVSALGNEYEISNEFCNFVLGVTKDEMLF